MCRCPYAQRSWMTLLEKGIDFEFKTVDLQAGVYDRLLRVQHTPAESVMSALAHKPLTLS